MEYGIHEVCRCGAVFALRSDGDRTLVVQLQAWREHHWEHDQQPVSPGVRRQFGALDDAVDAMMRGDIPNLPRDVLTAAQAISRFMHASLRFAERHREGPLSADPDFQEWLQALDGLPQ